MAHDYMKHRILNYICKHKLYYDIFDILYKAGFETHIVGGFLRDLVYVDSISEDMDIITNASPEEKEKIFSMMSVSQVGKLVTLVNGVQIATYRKDVVNTGRRTEAISVQVDTVEEDLSRRDFTINAIAFNPITGTFIDLFQGIRDIREQKINFIGNPKDRIEEDNERILRGCRMVALMGGSFGRDAQIALRENAHLIEVVPKERISLEITKTVKRIKKSSQFFETMKLIGVLKYIFPSLVSCIDQDGGHHHAETVWQHCMDAGDAISTNHWRTKLAGYLHDVGKPPCAEMDEKYKISFIGHELSGCDLVKNELYILKFSNVDTKFISGLILLHMNSFSKKISDRALRRFLARLETHNITYRTWFRLFIADKHANRASRDFTWVEIKQFLSKIRNLNKVFTLKLEINGYDVMETLSLGQGPVIGKILKECSDHCIDFPEDNNREFLLNFIRGLYYENGVCQ